MDAWSFSESPTMGKIYEYNLNEALRVLSGKYQKYVLGLQLMYASVGTSFNENQVILGEEDEENLLSELEGNIKEKIIEAHGNRRSDILTSGVKIKRILSLFCHISKV
jgi:hypothetical protein